MQPASGAPRQSAAVDWRYALLVGVALGWIGVWWAIVLVFQPSPDFLPSPWQVLAKTGELAHVSIGDGTLWLHAAMSLYRFLFGFACACAVGIPLGMLMAYFPLLDRLVQPLFEMIRPIPPIAWAPFAIIWFGASLGSQAFVIFTAALPPILINSYRGFKLVDRSLVNAALTLGARSHTVLIEVVLPASVPLVIAGMRIGLATGWMALIAAEIVAGDGASSGLGYLILVGQRSLQASLTIGSMIVIGVIGALLDWVICQIESRFVA